MEVGISRMSDANCGPGSESQDSGEGGEEREVCSGGSCP